MASYREELCFPEGVCNEMSTSFDTPEEEWEDLKKLMHDMGKMKIGGVHKNLLVTEMEEDVDKLIIEMNETKMAIIDLEVEQECVQEDIEMLQSALKVQQENQVKELVRLKDKIEALRKLLASLSEKVKKALTEAQRIYDLFKNSTGLGWDYSRPQEIAKGFVLNRAKDYFKPFVFDKNAMEGNVSDALWNEIAGAGTNWSDLE